MEMKRIGQKGEGTRELGLSRRVLRTVAPPISRLVAQTVANPGLVNFAAGLVDEESLPGEQTLRAAARVLARRTTARAALQYGDPQGLRLLREALVEHLEKLEGRSAKSLGFGADDIVLTTGSQQMLYLIAEALINKGDIVITASPSYFVYTGALASFGAKIIGIPMDDGGMDVEALEGTLQRLQATGEIGRLKFIYCTSFFQNPTGLTLARERRKRMLELVKRLGAGHRILLVEDAAYRELQYEGEPQRSIKSYDSDNQYAVLTQTFSKPFAPGLKLGYSVLPPDLREQVLRLKGNHDFGSANLCQWVALEVMRSGAYDRHVKQLREVYRVKRDLMLGALEQGLSGVKGTSWTHPAGGLYVWLSLPEGVDSGGEMLNDALAQNVLYVPGDYAFARRTPPRNHMRLSFGQVRSAQIRPGIRRLCEVIRRAVEKEGR